MLGNNVATDPFDVIHIRVVADMRHMTDPVATRKDFIEASVIIEISGMQRQPTG